MSVVNCQVQEGLCGPSFLRAGPTALPGPVVDEHGDLVFISSLRTQAARCLSFPSVLLISPNARCMEISRERRGLKLEEGVFLVSDKKKL